MNSVAMNSENNLSLKRSKQIGAWICLGTSLAAGLFLVGVFQGAYWALAIPVAVGVLGALQLAFWIGYTISTVDSIPEDAEQYRDPGSRRIAVAICAGSVLLAVLFLAGVFQGSYLALALPVTVAVLGMLGMVFWIGWAIVTQRSSLAQAGPEQSEGEGGAGDEAQDEQVS